jgi:hypothetical protein
MTQEKRVFKIQDALFKKPAGMEDIEHVSIKTMIANKTPFKIRWMVFGQKNVLDDNKQRTGETYDIADVIILLDDGTDRHIYLDKKNLTAKFKKMYALIEQLAGADIDNMKDYFYLRFIETPREKLITEGGKTKKVTHMMYDIEDVDDTENVHGLNGEPTAE